MNNAILIALMVFLVACSAFFSSGEIAFATANKLRLRGAAENGDRRARLAVYITENFTRFLSTVLVGNNLVNIAFSSVTTVAAAKWFPVNSELIAGVGATVILLIFGEIMPKMVASARPDGLVLRFSRPLRILMTLFSPVTAPVTALVRKASPIWTPEVTEPSVTDDELVDILESIEDEGVFTEREGELIRSAIEFPDVTAREILVPRVDVAAFDIDDDVQELLHDADKLSYSRIPVYEDTIDDIIGILSTKRLVKAAIAGEEIKLREMLMPPLFVHMTRTISSILKEFKRTRTQMAVVVDEFGGTMGILTMEDIVEEIVGEIYDESDDVEQDLVSLGADSYELDGGLNIEDMFELVGEKTPFDFDSEYTTVGGWTIEMLDRFPVPGDSFVFRNLTVTVLEVDERRVEKVRVDVNREADTKED